MGFPIKKRINFAIQGDCGPAPSGLDLLSAAIDARLVSVAQPEPAPSSDLGPPQAQGTIAPSLTREAFGGDNEESSAAPKAASSQIAASPRNKLSRPFPAILRDILSDPEHESVVSWLPHGQSFAVHDTDAFSSDILPKYFRKVVFRSFARKLNRWGFRSVGKSISGFKATFEHDLFRRDEPELSRGMNCRPNAAITKCQAAVTAGQAGAASQPQAIPTQPAPVQVQAPGQAVLLQTAPAQPHTQRPVISPSPSATSSHGQAGAASQTQAFSTHPLQIQAPGQAVSLQTAPTQPHTQWPVISQSSGIASKAGSAPQFPGMATALAAAASASQESALQVLRNALEEEAAVRLQDELALREMQRRSREREILQFLQEMPASQSTAVVRYIAETFCR